jgi:para-aminobenzoate synthetase component 1
MHPAARFPAGDIHLLKQKVIEWAINFPACICFDRNQYPQAGDEFDLLAAVTAGHTASLPGNGFASLRSLCDQWPGWIFGFLSYDLKVEVEPRVFASADSRFDGVRFPAAYFFVPEVIVKIKDNLLTIEGAHDPASVVESIMKSGAAGSKHSSLRICERTPKAEYLRNVKSLKEHIANGDLYEVTYCQEWYAEDADISPAEVYCRLNLISPAPFSCLVKVENKYLMCASPERFMMKKGNKICSQPMKGTIGRAPEDVMLDQALKRKLATDAKERAENVMIVDLVRNDLSRFAVPGSVAVEELFGVYSFPHIHQMVSTISATIREGVHPVEALRAAFPMGSMTGAPKVMAMQLIDRYEKVKRGLFSGSVGFFTPEGDFDFNVVIRSILYNGDDRYLSFQTGSAITHESDPEKEYNECLLKAEAMRKVLSA